MLHLLFKNTALEGKKIPLRDGLTFGSDTSCTLKAKHESMRPKHAKILEIEPGQFVLELIDPNDKDAHIFVNGKEILRTELRLDDQIRIGPIKFAVVNHHEHRAGGTSPVGTTEVAPQSSADQAAAHSSPKSSRLDALFQQMEEGEDQETYDFAREDLFYLTSKDPYLRRRICFTIPSRDRFLESAQSFLLKLAKTSGIDEMKLEAFITCAKELILNAHRHGHKYDETKTITIRFRDLDEELELRITDQGNGFDHKKILDSVRNLSAAEAARQRYQSGGFGGLGFQMICRLADRLKYNAEGNEVLVAVKKVM